MRLCLAILLLFTTSAIGAACSRPSQGDCKKAIANIRTLAKTDTDDFGDPESAIRSCRANASKESVKCIIDAKSAADLAKCEGDVFDEMFKQEQEHREQERKEKKD